jgi:hypothetical protein
VAARQPQPLDEDQVPEVEIDPDMDPANSEVTRPSDLGFGGPRREIEVEPIHVPPPTVGEDGMVEIRMAETIDEFTYGNPHVNFKLEAGRRYRVPRHVAAYLWDLGKLYTRS